MFSARLDWTARPNPIAALLDEKRRSAVPLLDLTQSNPTHAGIEYPLAITAALSDERAIRYQPEPFGLKSAREGVAEYYQAGGHIVEPSRIVLTASTSEAYAYIFKLLCDPGDEILAPRPSYPLFDYLAHLESVRIVQYPLFYDHGWHIDLARLRLLVNARTRAIVTVNPNNPTGSFLKVPELDELNEIALAYDLAIVSDEVFSDYVLSTDLARAAVVANRCRALTFSLSGLSKIVGLPQMKLGWMVVGGPATIQDAALHRLELIADTYLSVGTPVQVAAPALLSSRHSIQDQVLRRLQRNLEHLHAAAASERHIRILDFEGGWYVTLQIPRIHTEQDWVLTLLRDYDVLVQPGFFYDFSCEAFLVVSLLTEPTIFDAGVRAITSLVRNELSDT